MISTDIFIHYVQGYVFTHIHLLMGQQDYEKNREWISMKPARRITFISHGNKAWM